MLIKSLKSVTTHQQIPWAWCLFRRGQLLLIPEAIPETAAVNRNTSLCSLAAPWRKRISKIGSEKLQNRFVGRFPFVQCLAFLNNQRKNPSVSVKRLGFFISFFLPTKVLTFKGANVFQKGDQEFTNVCCNLCIVLVLATVYSWIDLLLNAWANGLCPG